MTHPDSWREEMNTLKKTIVMAIVLPLTFGSMSVLAAKDSHGMKGHHGEKRILKQLDLTDAQKEEMKVLRKTNHEAMKAQRLDEHQNRQATAQEMDKLILSEHFDEQSIRQLVHTMSEKQVEQRVARLKQRHQMLNILTPEQKVKYAELKKQKAEKHFKRLEKKAP
jgi:periplasmic protein CpxP/Spy